MNKCVECKDNILPKNVKGCPNCGAKFCVECAEKTKNICPYCYSSLEFSE